MCLFRSAPTPMPTPAAPIQPRNPDMARVSRLPNKKELVDPEDIADVEYGTGSGREAKDTSGQAKRQGTDALKINLNPGTTAGTGTGGMNV